MTKTFRAIGWMVVGTMAVWAAAPPRHDLSESAAFFKTGAISHIHLEVSPEAIARLKAEPREWVRASFTEDGKTSYDHVKIRLKGMAGSFRPIDDSKPAFTIKTDQPTFHGMARFHLNNSVQDGTYLHEMLSSQIFEAAGTLTARAGHARVRLNDRDLGLYVLKEGFDERLLARKFSDPSGKLYDSGFLQDIDGPLKESNRKGNDNRQELAALVNCCRQRDLSERWKKLPDLLDVDAFITFMAVETMLVHWDGYCYNRNNYRLYFDPTSKKAYFLPHGMDQMFAWPEVTVWALPPSLVAETVMSNPQWRAKYRDKVRQLIPLFDAGKLRTRINELSRRLQPELKSFDEAAAQEHAKAVAALKNTLRKREKSLIAQLEIPDPKPFDYPLGEKRVIDDWRHESQCDDAHHAQDGDAMVIRCGPSGKCVASWRKRLILPKGHYTFEATVDLKGVQALNEQPPRGLGAGLRVSGSERKQGFTGTKTGQPCLFEFDVAETLAVVDLVAELRCSQGEASFSAKSLSLTRSDGP